MVRSVVVFLAVSLLFVPFTLVPPPVARSAGVPMTVNTVERGGGDPVPFACYAVRDLDTGSEAAAGCDEDGDGTVVLYTAGDECGNCRITQNLPNESPGVPTRYLLEPPLEGVSWSGPHTFRNFLKPHLVVTFRDAHTRALLTGACITVGQQGQGSVFGGCDGDAGGGNGDQDGATNGAVKSRPISVTGAYQVTQTTRAVPAGYLRAAPVDVTLSPATPGEVEAVTLLLSGDASVAIKTVDSKNGKVLKGACYAVSDRTVRGNLGKICDGVKNGAGGDQDGKKNGIILLRELPGGHAYLIDQKQAPKGYRLSKPNKTVTTPAGSKVTVTIKNRAK